MLLDIKLFIGVTKPFLVKIVNIIIIIFLSFYVSVSFMDASLELGSVAGPVVHAHGRLTFEDDLMSGGLLCFIAMNASVRTELADSMVTPGEPVGD